MIYLPWLLLKKTVIELNKLIDERGERGEAEQQHYGNRPPSM
jgi:hypothetical protein